MAHTAPIILAFLINCCEIFIFRNILKAPLIPTSTIIARHIFAVGCYFLLLDLKLYPKKFRRTHWISRSFVEFILGIYIFETFICDFWQPLELFVHGNLSKLIKYIKKYSPKTGTGCLIACHTTMILSNKNTPIALSILLSTFITFIIIHGTRVIDIKILRNCGLKEFLLHLKDRLIRGIKRLIRSLIGGSCRSDSTINTTKCQSSVCGTLQAYQT